MKWISLTELFNNIKKVLFRFPLKSLIILLAAIVAIYMVDNKQKTFLNIDLAKVLCFCVMAFTLTLATDLYADAENKSGTFKWILKLSAVAVSALIMFLVKPEIIESHVYIIVLFVVAFHLAVAFGAFLRKGFNQEFWYFNKTIFLRILMCALYSGVIILGLCLAIFAVDKLFNANIRDETYIKVVLSVIIVFNTTLFLSGVPHVREGNYGEQSYPKGLKIFTQYVLIPLMTIYLAILLLYEIKILIEWELPNGYVSMLIIAYAAFGILSLLLIHPIRNTEGNKWIQFFSKSFYITMIPLLVLLVLAIYKRVSDYGITEERYALIALAVWLTGITVYFLLSKKDNIKVIPISLAVVALLAAVGPQSASAVSKRSQQNRFAKHYPARNDKDKKEAASIIRYLTNYHGLNSLQQFTKTDLNKIQNTITSDARKENYNLNASFKMQDTAFVILNVDKNVHDSKSITFYNTSKSGVLNTTGFNYVVAVDGYAREQTIEIDSNNIVSILKDGNVFTVKVNQSEEMIFNIDSLLNIPVEKYKDNNQKEIILNDADMSMLKSTTTADIKFLVTDFQKYYETDFDNKYFKGYLLIRKK